jgi:hypothetical protein
MCQIKAAEDKAGKAFMKQLITIKPEKIHALKFSV